MVRGHLNWVMSQVPRISQASVSPRGQAVLSLNDKRPLLARVWPAAQLWQHSSHLAKIRAFLRGLGLVPPAHEGPQLPWHPSLVHQGKGLE